MAGNIQPRDAARTGRLMAFFPAGDVRVRAVVGDGLPDACVPQIFIHVSVGSPGVMSAIILNRPEHWVGQGRHLNVPLGGDSFVSIGSLRTT
jgi:hypothetical protein